MKKSRKGKGSRGQGLSLCLRSVFRLRPLLIGAVFLSMVFLPATWAWPETHGADSTLHFFAVGQGDSSLVQCGRTQALIDGGPNRAVMRKLGRSMPFTDRRIEYVILSHPDNDHIFGLFEVLERYEIGHLIMSEFAVEHEVGRQLMDLAQGRGTEVLLVETGDTIQLGQCGEFEVLWPDRNSEHLALNGRGYVNDLSLVLEFHANDDRPLALFTGDINAEVEETLVADCALQEVQILKIPHHGSSHSSHYRFLRTLNPEHAVIQVGENNYGQPSKTVLFRLEKIGAQVSRNDTDGDIVFSVQSDGSFALISN